METDPFLRGRVPVPFAVGLYTGEEFHATWGKRSIEKMHTILTDLPPGIIYAHNGGKFDWHFVIDWIEEGHVEIIGGRIVRAKIFGGHEIRDSFSIYPQPLKRYNKIDIDIAKMDREVRDKYKEEILVYLKGDCVYLHEIVKAFHQEFGPKLTIGSASMSQLQKMHDYYKMTDFEDTLFRHFFFGGRCERFEKGILRGRFEVYDVNSMYPSVMKNYEHPIGSNFNETKSVNRDTCFVVAEGENLGAFPIKTESGDLSFEQSYGVFHVTIHEWKTALELGAFIPHKIWSCYNFRERGTFADFVDKFYGLRVTAKKSKDDLRYQFYKLILNSAYGKFAQNPDYFREYVWVKANQPMQEPWELEMIYEEFGYMLWSTKAAHIKGKYTSYYNVAIASSITGAARSILLEGLKKAKRPLYCDTDSIVCESLKGVEISDTVLGAWKYEGCGTEMAIGGKKMYALFDGETCIKQATKGCLLTPEEIRDVCNGKVIEWQNQAPTMRLGKDTRFLKRNIKMT